jgi:hypothetical protein
MSRQTKIVRRWIDSLPEGAVIRSQDLEHLVNRTQASRELNGLAKAGQLMRVARGMYVAVTASRFGPVPPPVDEVVQALAQATGHVIVRHGAAVANALGLTTQLPVRQIYLTDGRAQTLTLGKQLIEIRHVPGWMLVLGNSLAGDVIRAIEWLGPDLAEQVVIKLAWRVGRDEWLAMLGVRRNLPKWLATAIGQAAASTGVPFCR